MKENNRFPGFSIDRLLGVGATAEVFAAKNSKTGNDVALKVFSPVVSRDKDVINRLKEEASVLARLRHPNVVSTFGIQMSQDRDGQSQFAIELELVDGVDLRTWMTEHSERTLLIEHKLWALAQVARGLGAAHEIGALHRDLKPENILVSKTGDVKLTDFGLARTVTRVTMTRIGLLVGSLGYLAPEVINGERATVHSDIFSLGVIAYELLAGQPPYVGETPQALIFKLTQGSATPLKEAAPFIPTEICAMVDACLSKDPAQRPSSVWEIEACLMTVLSTGPLLRFAKRILSSTLVSNIGAEYASPLNEEELGEILSLKREWLFSNAKKLGRATALAEFHRLFPNDPGIENVILATEDESPTRLKTGRNGKRNAITAIVGGSAAASIALVFLLQQTCSNQKDIAGSPSNSAPLPAVVADLPTTFDAPAAEVVGPAPTNPNYERNNGPATNTVTKSNVRDNRAPLKGTLKFEVPDDVEVFVANELVPKDRLSNFTIAAGKYPMRMVKAGYLPIESVVDVKSGRVAVIRAGGQQ
jgi:serine/threonine protein kinase